MPDPDIDLPDAERPLWWRLSHVCGPFGFTPEVFLSAAADGQLPIRVAQFGERGIWYVNRADTLGYLRSIQATAGAST